MKWLDDLVHGAQQADDNGGDTAVIERPPEQKPTEDTTPAKPPMYAVILHNDGTTNPYFVAQVLSTAYSINEGMAMDKMMEAHTKGKAVVKIVSKDVAETQTQTAHQMVAGARKGVDYAPFADACELRFTVEPESGSGD